MRRAGPRRPLGKLTLNILMSFAQFEREMSSERTRDKVRAARRRGKWRGGRAPYGSENVERRLVVTPSAELAANGERTERALQAVLERVSADELFRRASVALAADSWEAAYQTSLPELDVARKLSKRKFRAQTAAKGR